MMSCSYEKSSRTERAIPIIKSDRDKPSRLNVNRDSKSYSQTNIRQDHDELLNQLKYSNYCFENYSEVTTFSTDSTIKHLQSLSAVQIEENLIENLESLDLACYPTLTLHFEACPSFEIVAELPFNNIVFKKASPDGIDTYNFSVFCSKSQGDLTNKLLDEYNDGFFGPAGLQFCFSSDFKVLYMGIVEENSGNTELFLVDLMNCSVIEKKRYNNLLFNVIKSGPYKDHLLTRDYSITGYGNYEILTQHGLVANFLGRYSVYSSLSDD